MTALLRVRGMVFYGGAEIVFSAYPFRWPVLPLAPSLIHPGTESYEKIDRSRTRPKPQVRHFKGGGR